jgi:replicative DNA helicase
MTTPQNPQKHLVEIPSTSTLPMGDRMQSALLGWMLRDDKVFIQVYRKVQASWFLKAIHQKLYGLILKSFQYIGHPPTKAELENYKEVLAEDPRTKMEILNAINRAFSDSDQIRWEAIRAELTEWLQSKILQDMIIKSAKTWNQGQWQQSARIMTDGVAAYRDAQFEEGVEYSFDNLDNLIMGQELERQNALTTGLPLLDAALLDGATVGGLLRGDTTILMAPSNAGKTTSMWTIARHNILAGKDVLAMSHEGRPEDLALKMLRCILGVSEPDLIKMYRDPIGLQRIIDAQKILKVRFTYIPYNRAGMKVEDVIPIIRRAQEERRAKTGKGYDLLVVDYPAKLTTEQQSRGTVALRNSIEIVYDYYVQLALEYKFHALLAIQTNREGSKVNKGENTNRLLMMEDVAEAFGTMMIASNVITLNRSPRAKKENWMTFYVDKSRSKTTGTAVVARTNFGASMTHADKMGCFGYLGTSTMEALANSWLNDPNKQGRLVDSKGQPIQL